jgi:hypothetical protein
MLVNLLPVLQQAEGRGIEALRDCFRQHVECSDRIDNNQRTDQPLVHRSATNSGTALRRNRH